MAPKAADVEAGAAAGQLQGDKDSVLAAIKASPVAMFGRTTCAFSLEAETLLMEAAERGGFAGRVAVYWLNQMPAGAAVLATLQAEFKQRTVPFVFVGGEFLGGCDDTKALASAGELAPKLYAAYAAHGVAPAARAAPTNGGGRAAAKAAPRAEGADGGRAHLVMPSAAMADPLFKAAAAEGTPPVHRNLVWFPELVDGNAVRATAGLVIATCALIIGFRERWWAPYFCLGLALDRLLAFCYAGGPSPLGQLGKLLVSPFKPHFGMGCAKQFAGFCALCLDVPATVFLFLSGFDSKEIIPAVLLAMHIFFALLEGALDFCVGCWMFGVAYQMGLLPRTTYALGIATKPEAEYAYGEATKRVPLGPVQTRRFSYAPGRATWADLVYKVKNDDHERQEFDPVKHCKIAHINAVIAVAGLALVFRAAADALAVSLTVSKVLQVATVAVFAAWVALYGVKAARYPQKVRKEWQDPLRSNSFIAVPAIFVILAACVDGEFDNSGTLATVLLWIGAPLVFALSLLLSARWVAHRKSLEHVNAAWCYPAIGCLLCAAVMPGLDPGAYTEPAWLWFSYGLMLWLLTFVLSFYKAVVVVDADDRARPLLFIWIAPPALAAAAWASLLCNTGTAGGALACAAGGALGAEGRVLYFVALSLALTLGLLFFNGHSVRAKFDASSHWAYVFPLEVLAFVTMQYYASAPGAMSRGMSYAGVAIASAVFAVCTLQTANALAMGGVFVTDPKYGPLSQQKLTHEAFRGAVPRLLAALRALSGPGAGGAAAVEEFGRQYSQFHLAHSWHSQQEDTVLFKAFDDYAPGIAAAFNEDHAADEPQLARWAGLVADLSADPAGAGAAAAVAALQAELPPFLEHLQAHLVGEEELVQPIPRKLIPIDAQKQIMARIWDSTPAAVWAEYLPWVIRNQPLMGQKVKFVRSWLWACPEKCTLIGRMLAVGVDAPTWARLTEQVPEIIPRGGPGHIRYH